MLFIGTTVLIFLVGLVLCSSTDTRTDQCVVKRTTISDQSQLDEFVTNISSYSGEPVCVELLIGSSFKLDLLQLMRIDLGANGSLMVTGNSPASNSVVINCISNITDPDELREMLQPISRAQSVLFDGLVFTQCPVPIVIEEVYNVMILNCVFL